MNGFWLPAAVLIPAAAAPMVYFCDKVSPRLRKILSALALAGEFALCLYFFFGVTQGKEAVFSAGSVCGMGISFRLDGFRAICLLLSAFLWGISCLFQLEYARRREDKKQGRYACFTLLTFSAVLGIFLSDTLFTTFIFFEVMSFTSYLWVLHEEREGSLKAAQTYLCVSVIAGMVMLMGLFLLYHTAGTLEFSGLSQAAELHGSASFYLAGALILVGFGAKAGMYPLHIWAPKAYPAAPAPASALLSGMLSKTGIYGILVISSNVFFGDEAWGNALLLLALITMFWGGVTALFSSDFKKIIACSSMSQIGFILFGIGTQCLSGGENALVVRGTILHIVNHSLFKLILFLLAGVVYMNRNTHSLNGIRGFGRGKPVFAAAFLISALGISGVPLLSGYLSKTLLHESVVELAERSGNAWYTCAEWVFLISGGLTFAYMLKIFTALFGKKGERAEKDKYGEKDYLSPLSKFALLLPCAAILILGLLPGFTADPLAALGENFLRGGEFPTEFSYFSLGNLKGAGISLLLGALFYLIPVRRFLMGKDKRGEPVFLERWPEGFDLEYMVYRPLFEVLLPGLLGVLCRFLDEFVFRWLYRLGMALLSGFSRALNAVTESVLYKAAMAFLGGVSRVLSGAVDTVIRFLLRHVYCPKKEKPTPRAGKPIMHTTGEVLDWLSDAWAKLLHRERRGRSYAEALESYEEESVVRRKMISASLSYGLLFCGVGLIIVMIYLLLEGR